MVSTRTSPVAFWLTLGPYFIFQQVDLDSPTPIPRRLIDTTAPAEFQGKFQQAAKCSALKIKADQTLTAATNAEGVSEQDKQLALERHRQEIIPFHQERAELTAWSQMTLAMFSTADNPHTNYQYIDDGMGEPHHGGEVPDAEFTASQLARYGNDLKSLRTTTQQPTTIKPYLSTPITECTDVVAFRNNLIAVKSSVGIYKLIPIGERIFRTRSSLERDDSIHNASNVAGRVLHNLKEKPNATKAAIVSRLVGIVGIAHRGYHTLNVESAKKHGKRIGDCMIEVAWTSAIPDSTGNGGHVGTIKMNSSVGYHTSFETRTDWRAANPN